ncbi:MAG: IS4 family transposase [Planctomycetota bacterium]|nr:IS4 family transposase [Planctomycetota bacterium]
MPKPSGFKYFRLLSKLLKPLRSLYPDPKRKIHYDQFVSLLLFRFFNPTFHSLRSLQRATNLLAVQKKLKVPRTALGSPSAASSLFDSQHLASILKELAQKVSPAALNGPLSGLEKVLTVAAGPIIKALPRMAWALWLDEKRRGAKLHLQIELFNSKPVNAKLTTGSFSERAVFLEQLQSRRLYLLDRGYTSFKVIAAIRKAKSSFVARMDKNYTYEVVEEYALTEADRKAGVLRDRLVIPGGGRLKGAMGRPVRLVEIEAERQKIRTPKTSYHRRLNRKTGPVQLLLLTDERDLSAEMIGQLYIYRWQVELFFRWLKCTLGCRHLLAHSKNGVELQLYSALIAGLLISLWTKRKPNKASFEILVLYFQGWATVEDLVAHVEKLKPG